MKEIPSCLLPDEFLEVYNILFDTSDKIPKGYGVFINLISIDNETEDKILTKTINSTDFKLKFPLGFSTLVCALKALKEDFHLDEDSLNGIIDFALKELKN